jgi:hypothetical protein
VSGFIAAWLAVAAAVSACRQPSPNAAVSAATEKVVPTYDKETGSLTKLEADSDHDGLIDMWAYMDGARVVRVDVDENGDGTVDRWEFHEPPPGLPAGQAAHEGSANGRSGREGEPPKPAMPRPVQLRRGGLESPDKTIERIERATRRDGVVSRREYFENGFLVRVEEDRNADGKVDKWETYSDGSLATMEIDTTHRGKADRRLVYRPNGTLDRIEVDPSGSGLYRPLTQGTK